ncbi:Protein of unknown function [Streptomyces aidingensis]|uniref:DUF2637 domain-containing protein n=2 Tax=Streptomyces aidingensis TaxID=910347 RepID=A0A1I1KE58_9ACTN|nr:Protein of unknown function [Streptomyces aidingensis]
MTATPAPPRITGWDRAAIVALGGAGCALSYDALQQMATAIHVRGLLTYLFPLVIDGFIAYGVRALLVMRTAPFPARLYVWFLFGTATAASIWANALHAVRLNQVRPDSGGLRLGDLTVGVLSTLAPLALAGAVHLYILIARRVTGTAVPGHLGQPGHQGDRIGRPERPAPVSGQPSPANGPSRVTDHPVRASSPERGRNPAPAVTTPVSRADGDPARPTDQGLDLGGQPSGRPAPVTRPRTGTASTAPLTRTASASDELLPIARRAVTETGRVTRAVVAEAIRGQGLPLSNARLTDLMRQLREDLGQPSDEHAA